MIKQRSEEVPARTFLQPIAAPSILGLYGFAGATFIVAANLAGWYGNPATPDFLFPFAAVFGGIAQFSAGMWAFKARDGLATAMHGMWGSFWIGYGILWAFLAASVLTAPVGPFPALGFWFIPLAGITFSGTVAALAVSRALFSVLALLGLGSALAAAVFIGGSGGLIVAAGWSFILSSLAAWYTATGMMFEPVFGRSILPLGPFEKKPSVNVGAGEPGVIKGQ